MPVDGRAPLDPLPSFDVAPGGNSVSGLSSGAFMAVQMHVAHSASFIGAGVIAGGPYRGAESFRGAAGLAHDAYIMNAEYICMSPLTWDTGPDPERSATLAREAAEAGRIDPVRHLRRQRVYLFTGRNDTVVKPAVVRATRRAYRHLGVRKKNMLWVRDAQAGHCILTDNPEDQAIAESRPPYINCGGYMQSHQILDHIYAGQNVARPAKVLAGRLLRFDQREFVAGCEDRASMSDVGFVYVPASVLAGRPARGVHIVLHGCKQGFDYVNFVNGRADRANRIPYGRRYVISTGYNYWAEANDLIVLYPQVVGRDDNMVQNPEGCWDWWGYSSLDRDAPDYHSKDAVQIRALHGMLQRLCGAGAASAAAAGAPPWPGRSATQRPPLHHALKIPVLQADRNLRLAEAAVGAARVLTEHADDAAWEEFWEISDAVRRRLQALQTRWALGWFDWLCYCRQIEEASTLSKLSARELNIVNQAAGLVSEQSVSLLSLCENIEVDVLHWMQARTSRAAPAS